MTKAARKYWDTLERYWPASEQCEHCDGVDSSFVRIDTVRGHICPPCDVVYDEMFDGIAPKRERARKAGGK
jgi:hypothetical protein